MNNSSLAAPRLSLVHRSQEFLMFALSSDHGDSNKPQRSNAKNEPVRSTFTFGRTPPREWLLNSETRRLGRDIATGGNGSSPATGRFREADLQWPLSGVEFDERIDATRPTRDGRPHAKRPFR